MMILYIIGCLINLKSSIHLEMIPLVDHNSSDRRMITAETFGSKDNGFQVITHFHRTYIRGPISISMDHFTLLTKKSHSFCWMKWSCTWPVFSYSRPWWRYSVPSLPTGILKRSLANFHRGALYHKAYPDRFRKGCMGWGQIFHPESTPLQIFYECPGTHSNGW